MTPCFFTDQIQGPTLFRSKKILFFQYESTDVFFASYRMSGSPIFYYDA